MWGALLQMIHNLWLLVFVVTEIIGLQELFSGRVLNLELYTYRRQEFNIAIIPKNEENFLTKQICK